MGAAGRHPALIVKILHLFYIFIRIAVICIKTPYEVAVLVVDVSALIGGVEGKVARLPEVEGNACIGKVQPVGPLKLELGSADDRAVIGKGHGNGAGLAFGGSEHAGVGVYRAKLAAALNGPAQSALGKRSRAARRVNAGSGELHLAAGGVDIGIGGQNGMVKLAGLSRIGNDHDGAGNGALIAVRGPVPQGETGSAVVVSLALALSCKGRGAAAVKVHGVNAAKVLHHKGKIIKIHAGRVRRLTAVDFIEHHGAVGFYADCRTGVGSLGSIGRIDDLAVSYEN